MVNQGLVDFIKQNLRAGYDAYSVRSHLIQNGYIQQEVDEAFDVVYGKGASRAVHIPKGALIIALILILVAAVIFAATFFLFPESSSDTTNPVAKPPVDRPVNIPDTSASTCYDGKRNGGETGIDCGGSCRACASCSDGILNQNEEQTDCGGICAACPTCTDRIQNQGEEGVDCGGPCDACDAGEVIPVPEKSMFEILQEIHDTAEDGPDKAVALCAQQADETRDRCYDDIAQVTKNSAHCAKISDEIRIDGCYGSVAQISRDSGTCSSIVDTQTRDACYMNFIFEGQYELCDNVQTDYYMDACSVLQKNK